MTDSATPPPPAAAAQRTIEHQRTRLLAMSFDSAASPSITLRALADGEDLDAPYGWGFAWYPQGSPAALVVKDPSSVGENAMTTVLREWERFASTIFLCHVRGAARTLSERDTHPFSRSYAGRDWVFAHNGDLTGDLGALLPLGENPVFEPVGRTDSEHAFCWLMTKVREVGARRLADVGWERLHGWLHELDTHGTANVLFTDGVDLVAHHDAEGYNGLFLTRLVPPHESVLRADDLLVDLGDASDRTRSIVLLSTVPLEGALFTPFVPGQTIVLRRGAFAWSSLDEARAGLPPLATSPARPLRAAPTGPKSRVLEVVHETTYRYARPVERSAHVLRLRPVDDRFQQVLAHELSIAPNEPRREYEDVFGNQTTHTTIEEPYASLRLVARSKVRVWASDEGLSSPRRRTQLPLVWMPWQRQMMLPYLLPPELPETELAELYEFAMSFAARQDDDLVSTLLDINGTIFRDFRYVSGSTSFATTAYQVFADRRGVCQDFANLFICLARLLSIPARYRVGYIYTGEHHENRAQGDASHAWVELYLPRIGWVGFDPTNGSLAGLDHVRVACGRSYLDATPTSGAIYKGGGGERLDVGVRVAIIG